MKPLRTLMFVPGNKPDWIAKAPQYGADCLIVDLEDSVPTTDKDATRPIVRRAIDDLRERGEKVTLLVRVNGLTTGLAAADLATVVGPSLDGIVVPKLETPEDVRDVDRLLSGCERQAGIPVGQKEVLAILESAKSFHFAYDIASASPRVFALLAGAAPGGDTARSIGYLGTPSELETLYLRSKAVLESRAAGLRYVIGPHWPGLRDLEGLERHCLANRQLGITGEVVMHPTHIPVVNRVYTPSPDEIAYAEGVVRAMDEGERRGTAAVTYQGEMIDYAMLRTARQLLELAQDIGVYNGSA